MAGIDADMSIRRAPVLCGWGSGAGDAHTPWIQAKHADRVIVATPPMATLLMFRRLAGRRLCCDVMLFYMSVLYTAQPTIMLEQMPGSLSSSPSTASTSCRASSSRSVFTNCPFTNCQSVCQPVQSGTCSHAVTNMLESLLIAVVTIPQVRNLTLATQMARCCQRCQRNSGGAVFPCTTLHRPSGSDSGRSPSGMSTSGTMPILFMSFPAGVWYLRTASGACCVHHSPLSADGPTLADWPSWIECSSSETWMRQTL